MIHPFKDGMLNQACPMSDVLGELAAQMDELKAYKAREAAEEEEFTMAPS